MQSVKKHIANGQDVNARDDEYSGTPLMWVSERNENPDIITTLITAGADVKAQNKNGKTAYDYIQENDALKDTKARWTLNDLRYK